MKLTPNEICSAAVLVTISALPAFDGIPVDENDYINIWAAIFITACQNRKLDPKKFLETMDAGLVKYLEDGSRKYREMIGEPDKDLN